MSSPKHSNAEQYVLARSFRYLLIVVIRLVLKTAKEQPGNWPAMQVPDSVSNFVDRNAIHAKPPNDPIYRQQPFK